MTIVLAMALMAIALALSYSVMRSQMTAVMIQHNSDLRLRARQAAQTGLAAGLRQMHQANWGGVNSTYTGNINATDGFAVAYATGDASLTPTNPSYSEYPYRVTLSITGSASDLANPGVVSSHSMQAVVRLVPRQLGPEPPAWPTMKQSTVFQSSAANFSIDVPCRIQGPLALQGTLQLCQNVPNYNSANQQYLGDLGLMPSAGYPDDRPLTGPVTLPFANTPSATRSLLTNTLGVQAIDTPQTSAVGWSYPGTIKSYQIYPGGEVYQVPLLNTTLTNLSLAPDPLANPLGIFYINDDLHLKDNVSVQGTIIADGTVSIDGVNVSLQSPSLPALDGATQPVQLPAVITGDDFQVSAGGQGSVQGIVAAFDSFLIQSGTQSAAFDLKGSVITTAFTIQPRSEWELPSFWWMTLWQTFNAQVGVGKGNGKGNGNGNGNGHGNGNGNGNGNGQGNGPSGVPYFPIWLGQSGFISTPVLTLEPNPSPFTYHWKNPTDPVYVANPSDPGLRWDVLAIADNPQTP